MSETTSTAAPASSASTASSTQTTTPTQSGAQGPATSGGGNASAGTSAQANGETQAQAEARILGDSDLDAYVEQKINGKVERIKVRDALKGYGLDKTANQRMQEAAASRKQAQELMHLMKTDFNRYCEVTGQDPAEFLRSQLGSRKEIAEEILAAEYERQQMSPEQRELVEAKQRLQTFEQRETEAKRPLIDKIKAIVPEGLLPKGLEKATAEQLQQYYQVKNQEFTQGIDNLSNELLGAWQGLGLPKVKEFGQWMAQTMLEHQKKTGESLHPNEAAAKVKARFLNSTRSLLSQMDAKAIQETLGEDVIQKIRDYDVQRVTQSGPQFGQKIDQAQPAVTEPGKSMNQTEWRKAMGIG